MKFNFFVAVGLVPGFLIGAFSTLILFSLWKVPSSHNVRSREIRAVAVLDRENQHDIAERRSEKRHVLERYEKEGCDISYLQSNTLLKGGKPYLLLILIHSSPRAVELRNAIRTTWLMKNHQQEMFVARFVIGMGGLNHDDFAILACENRDNGDLLLLPGIVDPVQMERHSSSEKLLRSLVWAHKNVNFFYLFKCTDSTFAILDAILKDLRGRNHKNDVMWGFFEGNVEAKKEGRMGEKNWFLCNYYIPYPQGGGYVISHGLVSILSDLSDDLQHYVHDDIALGVWLSPFNAIQHQHDIRFNTGYYYSRGCNNVYIVTHKETAQTMMKKYSLLKEKNVLCAQEFIAKPSYYYNWTVPANKCCIRKSGLP